jgi:excisionase family DNA binding protein
MSAGPLNLLDFSLSFSDISDIGVPEMTATSLKTHAVGPEERSSAKGVFDLLSGLVGQADGALKLVIEPSSGRNAAVVVRGTLAEAIKDLAGLMERGQRVSLFADDPEVTPEQASDLLGISRPTIVQRIRRGDLKAHMVGAHHRILMSSLISFRRREMEKAAAERTARSSAVRFAVANNAIEGGQVLPETEAMLDDWADGKIDDDELMEQTLRKFGPGV